MTTKKENPAADHCPAQEFLKLVSGKWKPQIFRLAVDKPLRFSSLLRQIEGSNKQAIAVALKELERDGLLSKTTIRLKPLHIEYQLTEKGRAFTAMFYQVENLL